MRKKKVLKEMLFHAKRYSELSREVCMITYNIPNGMCLLAGQISNYNPVVHRVTDMLKKYKKHINGADHSFGMFWFKYYDWKTRYSFLQEVCRIELNPINKLKYKLGLTEFQFITFEPSQQDW